MTGRRYANVLPDPVAAANATDRTGGIIPSSLFDDDDDLDEELKSTSNDE